MCNVCSANRALAGSATVRGFGFEARARVDPRFPLSLDPKKESAAEYWPALYQVRAEGDEWPRGWAATTDLTATMGILGFDGCMPEEKARRRVLCAAICESLRKTDCTLHGVYPGIRHLHERLIWPDAVGRAQLFLKKVASGNYEWVVRKLFGRWFAPAAAGRVVRVAPTPEAA